MAVLGSDRNLAELVHLGFRDSESASVNPTAAVALPRWCSASSCPNLFSWHQLQAFYTKLCRKHRDTACA